MTDLASWIDRTKFDAANAKTQAFIIAHMNDAEGSKHRKSIEAKYMQEQDVDPDLVDDDDTPGSELPEEQKKLLTDTQGDVAKYIGQVSAMVDKAMIDEVIAGVERAKDAKHTVIAIAEQHVKRIWGKNAEVLPFPGSTTAVGNAEVADVYFTPNPTKKKPEGKKEHSRLTEIYLASIGKAINERIEVLALKKADKNQGLTDPEALELDELRNDKKNGLGYFKDGVGLVKQAARFNALPYCGCEYYIDESGKNKGNINRGPTPIKLYRIASVMADGSPILDKDGKPTTSRADTSAISVQSFLMLDIPAALKKDKADTEQDQFRIVKATTREAKKRKPGKGQGATATDASGLKVKVNNVAQWESAVADMAALITDNTFVGNLYNALAMRSADGGYQNDDLLISTFKLAAFLDNVTIKKDLAERWSKLSGNDTLSPKVKEALKAA